jgi:hypothetical protein
LGYCIIRAALRRALFMLLVFSLGVAVTALSAALSYGPDHAWAWLSVPVEAGLAMALFLATVLLWLPRRVSIALMLLALGLNLSLLNQTPASAYFAQTLSTWEQGRFIRFHGLALWLGWLWPYAALLYGLTQLGGGDPKN